MLSASCLVVVDEAVGPPWWSVAMLASCLVVVSSPAMDEAVAPPWWWEEWDIGGMYVCLIILNDGRLLSSPEIWNEIKRV